ncbi:MAG TPA: hypothetical protein VFA77_05340 [Candidatus Eisenbacteria bacterium]|nr:hypothetical protein [Candidatus Eisenbacteria bacterium]
MNYSFLQPLLRWFRGRWLARPPWRRYRVTPRANPAEFRRQLLLAIRSELRRVGELPGRDEPRNTPLEDSSHA